MRWETVSVLAYWGGCEIGDGRLWDIRLMGMDVGFEIGSSEWVV